MIEPMPGDIFQRGQVLNNTYEIQGVLGRGGTGEVYLARNLVSGRVVAIKALNSRFSGNDDYIDLMRREEQMRDILNDAVVRYTECSRSDQGHVFLVMDYVDGPSLSEIMSERRMEARELLIVAHRVAEGLAAAHRRGIVHRDLSPDNIILRGGNPERSTIIDFGIAKDMATGARTIVGNSFAGKYEYAAPEQLEGKAEARSDLYALGALLLASFRGQVPFSGATPGEMVRRKQNPLDTGGVPEPLKGVLDRLTAPRAVDRPPSAEVLLGELDRLLKPSSKRGTESPTGGGARMIWLAFLPVVLAAGLGAAWVSGLFDAFLASLPPVASPYRLVASAPVDGAARLVGNAPDAAAARALADAYAAATGAVPGPDALTLATGMPSPDWPERAASAFATVTGGIDDWRLEIVDRSATVTGTTADTASRKAAEARLRDWSKAAGFQLSMRLEAGPRELPVEVIEKALAPVADCGPLHVDRAAGESYGLGDRIGITGEVANASTMDRIRAGLETIVGDRTVAVDVTALNEDICAVRKVLPARPAGAVSIWLGNGGSGGANLTGIYHVGDTPLVDVLVPVGIEAARLWVVVVDNTGKVYNLVPNINSEETSVEALGTVENGVRRIRVLYSMADFAADPRRLAMKISPTDFGKSEFIAILSRKDLFDIRRPRDESVASFAEALEAIQKDQSENIVAVATRLLDSRP